MGRNGDGKGCKGSLPSVGGNGTDGIVEVNESAEMFLGLRGVDKGRTSGGGGGTRV
jgi:hypothetical protein